MSNEKKSGYILEKEKYNIVIKDTKENTDNEIITFSDKKGKKLVEISADELLKILANNVRTSKLAVALSTVDSKTIPMVEVTRHIHGKLERDYAKGDEIIFDFKHMYPYLLAVLEKTYELCEINSETITEIPKDKYAEAEVNFKTENDKYIKAIYNQELKTINSENK